jgi:hypothetical protein
MADFCTRCHQDMGFSGEPDLDVEKVAKDAGIGMYYSVICEGCGMSGVGQDEDGNIIVFNEEGTKEKWDPSEDRMASYELRQRNHPDTAHHFVKEDLIVSDWSLRSFFEQMRFDKGHHLGLGDIRLTLGQQEEICDLVEQFYSKNRRSEKS